MLNIENLKKPHNITEIFKNGWILCKATYLKLLPYTLIIGSINTVLLSTTWKDNTQYSQKIPDNTLYTPIDVPTMVTAFVIMIMIFFILMGFHAAIIYTIHSKVQDKKTSFLLSLYYGYGKAFPLLGTMLLYLLAVGIGTLLFIIPGIYLAIVFSFSIYLIVIREIGIIDSFKESMRLVKDNWWKTAIITFIFALVFSYLPAIIMFSLQKHLLLAYAVHFLFLGLFYPLFYCTIMSLLYSLEGTQGFSKLNVSVS